jgi:hypothetical protein
MAGRSLDDVWRQMQSQRAAEQQQRMAQERVSINMLIQIKFCLLKMENFGRYSHRMENYYQVLMPYQNLKLQVGVIANSIS